MTISFQNLIGAAIMNNTFSLCIFLTIIAARDLDWTFHSEFVVIIVVQVRDPKGARPRLMYHNLRFSIREAKAVCFPVRIMPKTYGFEIWGMDHFFTAPPRIGALLVQVCMAIVVGAKRIHRLADGFGVLAIYPLSLLLVHTLESTVFKKFETTSVVAEDVLLQ